jgi:ribose transport system permease protein
MKDTIMSDGVRLLPYRTGFSEYWRDNGKIVTPFVIAALILIAGQIANSGFAEIGHLLIMIKVASFVGILAIAQTTVILSGGGGIDVSVGTMASMGALFSASIMQGGENSTLLAVIAVAVMGLILGLVNGYMVAYLKIHPLIMTLAMSFVVTGIIVAFAQGRKLLGTSSPALEMVVNGKIGGFHVLILLWIALTVAAEFILRRTRTGHKLLALGINERAAVLSGVNVQFFRFWVYGVSGMISAMFGALLLGYVHTVFLDVGNQYLFPSVVACAIGGIALSGGSGSYVGTLGGAIVYTFLLSFLITVNMDESLRKALFGMILIVLLIVYSRSNRER